MSIYPRLAGVNYESLVDGDGMRATIFLSGCSHKCPGCQNPQTWNPEYGTEITEEMIEEIANEIKKRSFLSGITISGGDPFYDPVKTCALMTRLMDYLFDWLLWNDRTVWMYTGSVYEDLIQNKDCVELLEYTDILVDGPFIQKLADKTLLFRGSSNQRIIDLIDIDQDINKIQLWKAGEYR